MTLFFTIVHVLTCLCLVAVVLLQHGKGADIGVSLGGGSGQTVFGARGSGNFLTKLTTGAAILFMTTSLVLSYFTGRGGLEELLTEEVPAAVIAVPETEVPESTFPAPVPLPEGQEAGDVPSGFEEIPSPPEEAPSEP